MRLTNLAARVQMNAAKAAAAANERRALDAHTPSVKPDLPKEPGGGLGLMDTEDFSEEGVQRRCLEWGGGSASSRRRRGFFLRLATGDGEAIVEAFDPRTREYMVKAFALYLRPQKKIPEVAVVAVPRRQRGDSQSRRGAQHNSSAVSVRKDRWPQF